MNKKITLTTEQKNLIYKMMFGEFKKEWFVNGILDNKDSTIARRLNLPIPPVARYTSRIVKNHFDEINQKLKS
jgi:hypothetical protein